MSDLRRQMLASKLPPLPPMPECPPGASGSHAPRRRSQHHDFTPLPWSDFFDTKETIEVDGDSFCVYRKGTGHLLVLLLHGGGYSGLTWSTFVEELSGMLDCQIVAPDLRGHGDTQTRDDYRLSNTQMVDDVARIMGRLFPGEQPPTLLMGHSMGGALAVRVALGGCLTSLAGVGVVDVVEGTALEALSGMRGFLRTRPQSFPSAAEAVRWCVQTGTVHSERSARVSMPAQVVSGPGGVVWRTELTRTEEYWEEWFRGLSADFLAVAAPKLLILAGTDRLDKEMMVGQMQGKFQIILLSKAGHAVHEDQPLKVAEAIATFAVRHKLASPKAVFKPSVPAC